MKWYAVDIYLEGRLPIETELGEDEKERLCDEWESIRSFSAGPDFNTIQQYEGRTEVEVRVEVTEENKYGWETRYVQDFTLIDLSVVVTIRWHEAVEQGE